MKAQRALNLLMLTAALAITASAPLLAQDESFDDQYPDETLTYVGLGAGPTFTAVFLNLDELNTLANSFHVGEFKGPLTLVGGQLMLTPIFVPNVRVGFSAVGGYHRLSTDLKIHDTLYTRTLRFGIRFMGGLQFDYAFPMGSAFTLLPGIGVGYGSYALELTQTEQGSVNFGDVWNPKRFDGDTSVVLRFQNRATRMLNFHVTLWPTLNFEYAFLGKHLMARAAVGYHLAVGDKTWRDEGGTEYVGVPNVSANGPSIQVGIFFGLFTQ